MARKKIFPLAMIAIAVGAFAYALRTEPEDPRPAVEDPAAPAETANEEEQAAPAEEDREASAEKNQASDTREEQSDTMLARERAEAERLKKAEEAQNPPEPEPDSTLLYQVTVEDAGTIRSGDRTIELAGIDARDPTDTCVARDGGRWPCGAVSRAALLRLIRGRAVECAIPASPDEDAGAICTVGGVNLSEWLLENGWAEPANGASEEFIEAHARAKEEHRGFYRTDSPRTVFSP